MAGPAAQALREHRLDPDAAHWLQSNFLKTELELGHCLRLPQEGPCECDLVLSCSKFVTTTDYAPRLRARLAVEQQLIRDASTRGWAREVDATKPPTPVSSSCSASSANPRRPAVSRPDRIPTRLGSRRSPSSSGRHSGRSTRARSPSGAWPARHPRVRPDGPRRAGSPTAKALTRIRG